MHGIPASLGAERMADVSLGGRKLVSKPARGPMTRQQSAGAVGS